MQRLVGEGRTPYWQRHLGSDGLFLMWIFFILMALSLVGLLPAWMADPDDSQQLCGVSMSCGANVALTLPFTAGSGLMLRASYPENFGGSILCPEADPDVDVAHRAADRAPYAPPTPSLWLVGGGADRDP